MTGRLSREQIIARFELKMRGALEGTTALQEVCGLSIEALRTELIAERNRLLKEHGYGELPDREKQQPDTTTQRLFSNHV